jgi:protein phosphatase 1 regulatory subunit 7
LEDCVSLESLWLGKNKIEVIEGLETNARLRQLDVQSNRLTRISGIAALGALEELYLAHNAIESLAGLPLNAPLSTVDVSSNRIVSVAGVEAHPTLEELWMSGAMIDSFEALLPLTQLPALSCLYLEHSPLAADFEYRLQITRMLPALVQLDATSVNRDSF